MDRKLSITEWLVLINIIFYVILAIIGFSVFTLNEDVLVYIGQYNKYVFERGYVWELATALFVHFHLGHLMGNMLFLLLFGYRAEDFFNWREYLTIYLVSGFVGNLLSLLLGSNVLSAGASGAIFGIFGAILYPIKQETPKSFKAMIFIGIIFLIFAGLNYKVDHFSHWAGFVVGIFLGKYLTQKKPIKRSVTIKKIRSRERKY
ncbi:MAG: rhomboid family intramembrane serine protease [Candidatus Helarchaeota archaeon]